MVWSRKRGVRSPERTGGQDRSRAPCSLPRRDEEREAGNLVGAGARDRGQRRLTRQTAHRSPRDPMLDIDRLLLEDLMLQPKPDHRRRGRALETASIIAVLLCLIGIMFQATWMGTTVVVASPPEIDGASTPVGAAQSP